MKRLSQLKGFAFTIMITLISLIMSSMVNAALQEFNFYGEFDEEGGCASSSMCGPYNGALTIETSQIGTKYSYGDGYLYIADLITVTLADGSVLESSDVTLRVASIPDQQEIATYGSLFDPIYLFWRTPLDTFQTDNLADVLNTLQSGPFISSHIRIWDSDLYPACEYHCIGTLSALMTESLTVSIDIRPGSEPNSINPRSKGVITVAILTAEDFDALQVDPGSVRFGPAEAERTHKQAHVEDVDYDGDMDLVFHFRTQETGIQCGDTEVTLTGETFDGRSFAGIDSIRTVNCKLTLTFTPVEWTIARDTHGAGIHTIFMIADVSPLVVDDLQDLGGELIWDETQITLCADPTYPPELQGKFISIRDVGDGFLRIGDGFQSNSQGPGCDINTAMQNAFDEFGLPNNACLSVRSGDINYEFCAPLNIIQ